MSDAPLVPKWEYMIIPMTSRIQEVEPQLMDHKEILNALGAVGWELVCIEQNKYFVLKKPLC